MHRIPQCHGHWRVPGRHRWDLGGRELSVYLPRCNLSNSCQGLGPIGLCAAKFAQLKGAGRIIGIDQVPERLKKAQEIGLETLDFSKHTDVVKRLQEIAPGGLNVALDCGMFGVILRTSAEVTRLFRDIP